MYDSLDKVRDSVDKGHVYKNSQIKIFCKWSTIFSTRRKLDSIKICASFNAKVGSTSTTLSF